MTNTQTLKTRSQAVPLWAGAVVAITAVLMCIGGVIALVQPSMLVAPHVEINEAVRTYAGYLTVRNGVLGLALLFLLGIRAQRSLANLAVIVGLIQIVDFVVDCVEQRWTVAPGVLILGILLLLAASRLSGTPLWRREAWI